MALIIAYLDPGTGSLILQAIVGAITGALLLGKVYWRKIKGVFKKDADAEDSTEDSEDSEEEKDA